MPLRAKLKHLKYCLKYSRPVVVTYFAQIVTGTIFILFRRYGGGIIVTSYFGSTEKQKGKIVINRTRLKTILQILYYPVCYDEIPSSNLFDLDIKNQQSFFNKRK